MKIEILSILLFFFVSFISQAQKENNTNLFSKHVSEGRVSGYLVGRDPRNQKLYYFRYSEPLEATVTVNLSNRPSFILDKCYIKPPKIGLNVYMVEIFFTKEEIKKINKEDPLSFSFQFRFTTPPKKVINEGRFITGRDLRRPTNLSATPNSDVDFNPGFIVTAPEELSILLIQGEIEEYLTGGKGGKRDTYDIGSSNFTELLSVNADNISKLSINIYDGLNRAAVDSLYQILEIYHFCSKYLDSSSFFRYEGSELKRNINSLQSLRNSNFKLDSLEFYDRWILQKKHALVEYEKTINKLEFLKNKATYILENAFLEFRD